MYISKKDREIVKNMTRISINRGKQLKFAREYREYTQAGLCKCIKGLSQSDLSKYEKGFEGMIADDKIAEIMKHLNWPLGWLDRKASNVHISWDF